MLFWGNWAEGVPAAFLCFWLVTVSPLGPAYQAFPYETYGRSPLHPAAPGTMMITWDLGKIILVFLYYRSGRASTQSHIQCAIIMWDQVLQLLGL